MPTFKRTSPPPNRQRLSGQSMGESVEAFGKMSRNPARPALVPRVLFIPLLLLTGILGLTTLYHFIGEGTPHHVEDWTSLPHDDYLVSAGRLSDAPNHQELPRIHLFMPIDRVSKADYKMGYRFCRVLQCAIVNGWRPNVFNWEAITGHTWEKPFGLKDILDSPILTADMAPTDLILMIDSLDVFLQLPPSTMIRRFLEYKEDIIVGAEKNCWPNSQDVCGRAPKSPLPEEIYYMGRPHASSLSEKPPAHANSGTVIGTLAKMREFYATLTEYMQSDQYKWRGIDDQGAFNDFVAEGKVKLDYYSRLFWLAYEDADNVRFQNTRYHPDSIHEVDDHGIIPWDQYPPLGHHLPTGEVPAALHCNGPIKDIMDSWWGKSWWNSKSERFRPLVQNRMDKATVRFVEDTGYREESVRELCPMLDIWD